MLTNFTQIIGAYVPSEPGKVAIGVAVDLCKKYESKLTVLNVNKGEYDPTEVKQGIEDVMAATDGQYGYVEKKGKPFREILDLEKAIEANLIVMGTHGSKGRDPDWIGGNAFKVISGSSCPVLLFPPEYDGRGFKNIVMPLGDSSESRQKVPLTVSIAEKYGSIVHILIVHQNKDPETAYKLRIYADQAKKYCEDHNVPFLLKETHNKNMAEACLQYTAEVDADLLTVMSERESPTSYFMGHYAQELVNKSKTPVLTIHVKDMHITGNAGY